MATTEEFNEEKSKWLDELSKRDEWQLIEQKGNYYYYRNRLKDMQNIFKDIPFESRIKFYKGMIIAECGVFCPKCDKLMISVEEGTEWTGGIFSFKSRYNINKCKKCGYKIKW